MPHVAIIGSGFAGLSAACFLARDGFDVTVFEKNSTPGGRGRRFSEAGFTFDMGPTWYWMPDVFERFFAEFGKRPRNYYELQRLDPSYRVYFANNDRIDVPAGPEEACSLFERIEPGSGERLQAFLKQAGVKYQTAFTDLVYRSSIGFNDLLNPAFLKNAYRLDLFQSVSRHVRKFVTNERLISLLEFPVLFLGAKPQHIPALYTMMNYADIVLGTWYPKGGMHSVVQAMMSIARELGVQFHFNCPVSAIEIVNEKATALLVHDVSFGTDYVVAAADYHHVEQQLLPRRYRRYSAGYWNRRTLAPSCLMYFVGLNKKLTSLRHHTLFFDKDFATHALEIYDDPQWPSDPQFYVSCPSVTDPHVAPVGYENLTILVPVAPGLDDSGRIREKYFQLILSRLESITGEDIRTNIVYRRCYAHTDFTRDYNAFRGNAYGLANTLSQTANFKPSMTSSRVDNLFYAGQLTAPGPGVPPAIISGQMAASWIIRKDKKYQHAVS